MRRATPIALALAMLPLAFTTARAAAVERHDFAATMSDGITLEASVYLPADAAEGAELPLIVRQHGGGSNKDNAYDVGYASDAVETGNFAALLYSHRGHGKSGGLFDFFGLRTTQDFSEMLDIVEGRFGDLIDTDNVGASGYSQGGGESLLPAAHDARVKALAVGQTFADLNHALNPNDCFKFSFATGIFAAAYKLSASRTNDELAIKWGTTWNTDTEDVGVPGQVPSTTQEVATRSPVTHLQRLRVPTFWTQAWEDQLFPGDHPQMVLKPLQAKGVPVHYWFSSGGHAVGGNFLPEEEAREAAMIDWFDEFLRGVDHGYASGEQPVVDYWRRTTPGIPGEWVPGTAADWPVPDAQTARFYPSSDGTLEVTHPAADDVVTTLANPFPTVNLANDAITNEIARNAPGMGDVVRGVPEDPAGATFASAPLSAALDLVGAPRLNMPVDTTALRVVQLDAKVWDVSDAGATLVARGCTSVEQPGVTIGFELWPNAHRFEPGHRIVLSLSSTDYPTFKPDTEPAATQVLAGATLELPVR